MADVKCWGCQQVVRFYPEAVPMTALAEIAGMTIGLCDRHWSWWVAFWLNSDHHPGCNAYLIGASAWGYLGEWCQGGPDNEIANSPEASS